MQLPIQAQSTYFVADWERSASPADMATVAQACDDAGFAYVAVCDHVALPEAVAGTMGYHWVDPVATLAWLAAQTTNVHLLSHVYVLAYRHPLMAAKQFSTIDHLSGGRVICGIGAGHVEAEFDLLGADFAGRGPALDVGVPLLARALANEVVDGFGSLPRPVQSPRPPIWLAGSSAPAIRRAADWLMAGCPRVRRHLRWSRLWPPNGSVVGVPMNRWRWGPSLHSCTSVMRRGISPTTR